MSIRLDLCLTGACCHPERSTRRDASWKMCSFPMFASVIDRGGDLTIFDPGYAPRMHEATEPFPERLYRWTTPTEIKPEHSIAARLKTQGRYEAVTNIVISHFHADHMAGLLDFPDARVVCSRAAFEHFAARDGFAAVSSGYLKELAPFDLERRIHFVEDLPRALLPNAFAPFKDGHDLYGDGAVILTHLPGHAHGQIGAALKHADGAPRFLIADAAWSMDALKRDAPPPWATMRFLGRPRAYLETWTALRAILAREPDARLIPAHCAIAAAREGAALA